ncbi:MAG TPA: OsmC family protein [Deinococcales bacterium]|nr:OsmC family protein [Deinococcales bacterium]
MSTKRLRLDSLGGRRFVAQNERGDRITLDASPAGGSEPAPIGVSPMEALLAALAACTAIDVRIVMEKKRTPLDSYRIEVEAERADGTYPQPYTSITLRHVASGAGVTLDALEKAAHLSHEKYCSVAASLDPKISVRIEVALEDAAAGGGPAA